MDVLKSLPPAPTGGPNVAVDSVLPPAGLIGVDHRTAADAFQRFSYGRPGLLRHLMNNTDDGANAQFQLMHRPQVPLDGLYGQPAFLPQGRNQADQVDPQPLPAHGHFPEGVPGQPPFPAQRTPPGDEDVFCNFGRTHRKFDDLPGPLHPTPAQGSMAFGARLRGVDHPPGGFHPRPGEAVLTLLSRLLLLLRRLLAPGGRFMPRHPGPQLAAGQPGFQALNPLAQFGDDPLLFRDDRQQGFPARLVKVQPWFHCSFMPQLRPGRQHFSARRRASPNSPH